MKKAILIKVMGDYYVDGPDPEVLSMTKNLLGSTMFNDSNDPKLKKALTKILSFDLQYSLFSVSIKLIN